MARVLVIDDDELVRKSLFRLFNDNGHHVVLAGTLGLGMDEAHKGVDVIFLDLDLPDGDGLRAIDDLAAVQSRPEVIVLTGMGANYGARRSMESSAWDYMSKPASPVAMVEKLNSALAYRREKQQEWGGRSELDDCGIIGESASMSRTLDDIGKAALSEAGVLIRGETGVGKELAAKAIHQNSKRKNGPFVTVDCSNLTESLVESTLYGHVKGAFTGANEKHRGLIGEADGGTLFLDEVGELPGPLQKSFLRVLQEKRFRPVGSSKEKISDFRLVAATHRDLTQMAMNGGFRSDLLFRIRTVEIIVPPLRERGRDIEKLVRHFISQTCDRYGLEEKTVSKELLRVIEGYDWPGNIRELMNVIEAAVIKAGTTQIVYPKHLQSYLRLAFLQGQEQGAIKPAQSDPSVNSPTIQREPVDIVNYAKHKALRDQQYFNLLMEATGGDVAKISSMSGLSIPSVYRHLALAGISTKKKPGNRG